MSAATEIKLLSMSRCSKSKSKSCPVKDDCDYQTAGSQISNWFFVQELTRTVGAETADRWVRHQTVHSQARLKRCHSDNPEKAKTLPVPNVTFGSSLKSTSFESHQRDVRSLREMTAIGDEAADMSFPQQPKAPSLIDLYCFRDTSSFLPSQSRHPRSSCGAASASISALCDRRVISADLESRMGLLFTDAAHTVLD